MTEGLFVNELHVPYAQFLGFVFIDAVYSLIGTLVFIYVEECSSHAISLSKSRMDADTLGYRTQCTLILEDVLKSFNHTGNFTSTSSGQILLDNCMKRLRSQYGKCDTEELSCSYGWSTFSKWLRFSAISISTIGYGNTVPQTEAGKLFLICFTCFGIPLIVITYTYAAKVWTSLIRRAILSIERYVRRGNVDLENTREPVVLLVTFSLLILSILIAGAVISHPHLNNWTYVDSIYYWWVTVTTIGFGDFTTPIHVHEDHNFFVILGMIYVILALGLIAGSIDSFILILFGSNFFKYVRKMLPCIAKRVGPAERPMTILQALSVSHPLRLTRHLANVPIFVHSLTTEDIGESTRHAYDDSIKGSSSEARESELPFHTRISRISKSSKTTLAVAGMDLRRNSRHLSVVPMTIQRGLEEMFGGNLRRQLAGVKIPQRPESSNYGDSGRGSFSEGSHEQLRSRKVSEEAGFHAVENPHTSEDPNNHVTTSSFNMADELRARSQSFEVSVSDSEDRKVSHTTIFINHVPDDDTAGPPPSAS